MGTVRPHDTTQNPTDGIQAEGDMAEGENQEEPEEALAPRMMKDPKGPSKDEWDQHVVRHLPFRDWSPH